MHDIQRAPWMHIYGQFFYHHPATIRGNREALVGLRDAIDKALETGEAKAEAFATDGEGYEVKIVRVNTMATLGRPEYLYELEYSLGREAAERDREFKLKHKSTKLTNSPDAP